MLGIENLIKLKKAAKRKPGMRMTTLTQGTQWVYIMHFLLDIKTNKAKPPARSYAVFEKTSWLLISTPGIAEFQHRTEMRRHETGLLYKQDNVNLTKNRSRP